MGDIKGTRSPRNRKNLVRLLAGLSQTLVIATCNMNLAAAVADRAILMDSGRIVADADAGRIMSDSKLMAEHGLEVPQKLSALN